MKSYFLIFLILLVSFVWSSDNPKEVLKKQVPFGHEKSLKVSVSFGNGSIYMSKITSNNIFEGEFVYEHYRPQIHYEVVGKEGHLEVFFYGKVKKGGKERGSHHISSLKKIYDNKLQLNISDKIPLDLNLELGVVKGTLDLSGLMLRNLDLEIGVCKTSIIFDEPNPISLEHCSIEGGVGNLIIVKLGNANVENFRFEGGVGSYELDFTGEYRQNISAEIEMGMGKLTLYLPRYVGTRIKVEKSFLSSFSIDECYKKSNYYYNDKWEKTPYQLDIEVNTGVGKVEVIWEDN